MAPAERKLLIAASSEPVALPAPAPPVLLINLRSARASRGTLSAKAAYLARKHGLKVVELQDWGQLRPALDALRNERRQRLWVLAGDGTVRTILEYIAQSSWKPALLVLGGGRSNAIAREFGAENAIDALGKALRKSETDNPLSVESRPLLTIEAQGAPVRVGLFFAAGLVESAIRLCAEHRAAGTGWLHTGVLSSQYRLAKLGVEILLGRSPLPAPPDLHIVADRAADFRGLVHAVVATTLRQRGLFSPFRRQVTDDDGRQAIRMTAIKQDADRLWRRVPRLLTGRFAPDMDSTRGFLSGEFKRIEIAGLKRYSLDGELFEVNPSTALCLGTGPLQEFLRV